MRQLSLTTIAIFVVSILSGSVVLAGEYDRGKHEGRSMHWEHRNDCDQHRHKSVTYQKGYHRGKHRGGSMLKKFWNKVKKLDLSKDQMSQLYDLKFEWKLDRIELQADIDRAKVKMHRLKYQDDVRRQELERHIDQIYDARATYKKRAYNFKMDVKDHLTQDQLEEIKSMMSGDYNGHHDGKHRENTMSEFSKEE